MLGFIRRWQEQKKARDSLVKIVHSMQAEEAMILDDLARQVEQKLLSMPPEEALKAIRRLKGE
jgi:hypothetical protein